MIDLKAWATSPADHVYSMAVILKDVLVCARMALEIDGINLTVERRAAAACRTLEVAEALADILIDGTEILERDTRRGSFRRDEVQP